MTAGLRWVALALLGLAIAAGIAFAASRVVSQPIGLSGQSFENGRELAPPTRSGSRDGGSHPANTAQNGSTDRSGSSATTTVPPTSSTVAPPTTSTYLGPASTPTTTTPPATTNPGSPGDDHHDD